MLLASLVSKHSPQLVQSCDVLTRLACCYVVLPSAVTVSKDYDCSDGDVGFRCHVWQHRLLLSNIIGYGIGEFVIKFSTYDSGEGHFKLRVSENANRAIIHG